jgi:hypothetical protein
MAYLETVSEMPNTGSGPSNHLNAKPHHITARNVMTLYLGTNAVTQKNLRVLPSNDFKQQKYSS